MKKLATFSFVAVLLALAAATLATYSPNLFAQLPADQAVTRPDHLIFGDWGTCNEGETEYNMTTHTARRCGGNTGTANTWTSVVQANLGAVGTVLTAGATTPVYTLVADANFTPNTVTGLTLQRVCHVTYNFAVDGGATPIVPAANCVIPINSIITNVGVQSTTAVTATGAATVALGCVGGTACGASALMAATAKASLGTAAFGQSIPVPQTASTWVKTTAATGITLTVATGPLTAGVLEIYVYYVQSST